ncbi:trypsin-like peptidase domain-containing protein [Streptomyces piniterrae]|uniref:Trypsin-like peptidase domain-containing protein n=1 Tax=Streptomyces piniterrae TaxID=2571125 RepID=A0A4U0N918_9ACTN|nr:serine protease [Streptomyces piniterrae]TJZ50359.1 trypsin-like peptidase domain-containing protein [Streptomyces piniterrae]
MNLNAVAEVWSRSSGSGWIAGSGHVIAGRLLLTAAHTVPSDEVRVRLLTDDGLREGRVVWRGDGLLDAALVEVADATFDAVAHRPVRFGRLISSAPGTECEAVGFPDATRAFEGPDQLRDTEHLTARLNPLTRRKQRLLDLRLDNWPDHAPDRPSRWSGMSGAGVWCGELLAGVVAWDTPSFGQRRLTAVPLAALAGQTGFRRVVERHTGHALRLEAVELAGLLSPCYPAQLPASPAALLRAEHEVVPFTGREDILRPLVDWCQGPEQLSAWLVSGPGGQGKSRLARRLNELMSAEDWTTGQIADLAAITDQQLTALSRCTAPVLLVLDYAETRPELAQEIIDHLAAHPPRHPVRLLLLARAAGEWFTALYSASPAMPGTLRAGPLVLPALAESPTAQDAAWRDAIGALRKGLRSLGDEAGLGGETEQTAEGLAVPQPSTAGQALSMHIAALASLLPRDSEQSPEQVLLTHERRYWDRVAERRNLGLDRLRPLAMLAAQLCGPTPRTAALEILAQLPGLRGDGAEQDRRALAEWIHDLYPPTASGDAYWGTLQPDPLAEHYIIHALGQEARLATKVLVTSGIDQRRHGVTLLARAAARPRGGTAADHLIHGIAEHPMALGHVAVEAATRVESPTVLVQALEALVAGLKDSAEQLETVYAWFPGDTHVLAKIAAGMTSRLVDVCRGTDDKERLCSWLSDHSIRLGDLGRRAESLAATDEAVELLRRLAAERPEKLRPKLARVLANHSNSLSKVGRRAESLEAATEAVAIFHDLSQDNPQAFVPALATSLINQASALNELGHGEAAVRTSCWAVHIFRQLVTANPGDVDCGIGLALALDNQSQGLSILGLREESLAAINESTCVSREFADERPDAFLPRLAAALSNQSLLLRELGHRRKALETITESVAIRRRLAKGHPEAFEPALAAALTNQATMLKINGNGEGALAASCDAVTLYRKLAEVSPDFFLPELASSLVTKSSALGATDRDEEALEANSEAVGIFANLAEMHPDLFLPRLAGSLNNQSNRLQRMGKAQESLAAADDSVQIFRKLSDGQPDAYLPDLAKALTNQSAHMGELMRIEEALEAITEAVAILQELAARHPDAFLPNFAGALGNQSVMLRRAGRLDEAVAPSAQAVEIFASLARSHPDAFSSDLARAIDNHADAVHAAELLDEPFEELPEELSPEIHWTPLRQDCGCVIDWGWEVTSVPLDSFVSWCTYVVALACPWHGAESGQPLDIPDGVPVALRDRDCGTAIYARQATGEDIALGKKLADALQAFTEQRAASDRSSILAEIPPQYQDFLRAGGYDPVEAWLEQRLVDIILNRTA